MSSALSLSAIDLSTCHCLRKYQWTGCTWLTTDGRRRGQKGDCGDGGGAIIRTTNAPTPRRRLRERAGGEQKEGKKRRRQRLLSTCCANARIRSGPPCRRGGQSRPPIGCAKWWETRYRVRLARCPILPHVPREPSRTGESTVPRVRPRCYVLREVPEGLPASLSVHQKDSCPSDQAVA